MGFLEHTAKIEIPPKGKPFWNQIQMGFYLSTSCICLVTPAVHVQEVKQIKINLKP
ncbi:MAG: hypothetical protein ACI8V2_002393 [Candidatus Latescibacterota bacterium]|jgi:hypothetical protein